MNPVIEIFDDVDNLLKSLEKSGITLLEKPVFTSSNRNNDTGSAKSNSAAVHCHGCSLYKMGLPQIKGQGTSIPRVVFVSSWPDAGCLESGSPVSGESGELLERIIKAMNLEPENVYITNIVKCLPPGGLIPVDSDVSCCMNYLKNEISALKPIAIILLGRFATLGFIGNYLAFESIEGKFQEKHGLRLMPTYHPDDLIKDASKKRNVWEAMKKVMALISSGGES
ncbi:uracil-DNA glycosylase [Desulforegula conservatrix]|uniref:uracil-DNA glycosylase n=1 Tax=Desulforegula conservatrix TaxID=153026 RepID=UPI0004191883|nr:uracil-DNA glycosylase [Desulforegula conservatrix]